MRLSLLPVILACACATASSPPPASPAGAAGAADAGTPAAPTTAPAAPEPVATPAVVAAALESRSGSTVTGNARITPAPSGVVAMVEVQGATPGEHGVHIHDKGDCSAPDATSAGPHYNPKAAAHHGGVSTPVRHAGDLGNMQVDSNGRGLLVVSVADLSMDTAVGRSVVVHAGKDDLQTDPAGNSGARVACGTLKAVAQ